jgi:hypothetical protein
MQVQLSHRGPFVVRIVTVTGALVIIGWTMGRPHSSGRERDIESKTDRAGVVFIGEQSDLEDSFRLTGRFSAHFETTNGDEYTPGPQGVPLSEAVEWGRKMARVVLVRVGDDDTPYSAGEDLPDFPAHAWPRRGLDVSPRPYGSKLDGSEQHVRWALRAALQLDGSEVPTRALRQVIAADTTIEDVVAEAAKDGTLMLHIVVEATGAVSASELADRALTRAITQLIDADVVHADVDVLWISVLGRAGAAADAPGRG